jgi:hypothetical protein
MDVSAGILKTVVEQNNSIKTAYEIYIYFISNPCETYLINFPMILIMKSLSNKSDKETIVERLFTIKL